MGPKTKKPTESQGDRIQRTMEQELLPSDADREDPEEADEDEQDE
jgi:hypothetical protein